MKRSRNKGSTLKKLWRTIAKDRWRLVASLFASLLSALCVLLTPVLIGRAVDSAVGPGQVDFPALLREILLLGVVYLLYLASGWCVGVLMGKVASHTVYLLRREAFQKLQRLPVSFFDTTPHGDVVSRLTNDIDAVYEGIFGLGNVVITGVVTLLGSFAMMLTLNLPISGIVLVITPFAVLLAAFITRRTNRFFTLQSERVGELNGFAEEAIAGLEVIQACNSEGESEETFRRINDSLYDVGQKAQFYSSLVNPTTRVVNNLTYILVGCVGGMAALAGGLTVGGVSAFLGYSTQFAKPINEISAVLTQIQAAMASARRIFELTEQPEEKDETGLPDLTVPQGGVTFEKVNFSYRPETPLITDLNLDVPPDSVVSIVGSTGAGKTTLVNLLMRFYDVDSGSIKIDGTDLSRVTRKSLRGVVAMVLQDTYVFEGSIFENIAYGKENATREEVITAAKQADAHSFIRRLPKGYNTVIRETGEELSHGQKQLITIARAMLRDPQLLILDEATSSVDTLTELRIQRAFQQMMRGKTSFVIAHRLSTIRDADIILVMEQGNIVEKGTHRQLLEQKGVYWKLYHSAG